MHEEDGDIGHCTCAERGIPRWSAAERVVAFGSGAARCVGKEMRRKCCVYVVVMEVVKEFYVRGQTSLCRRDMTANDLTSLRLIVKLRDSLPVSTKWIRKTLANTRERGNFWSPIGII